MPPRSQGYKSVLRLVTTDINTINNVLLSDIQELISTIIIISFDVGKAMCNYVSPNLSVILIETIQTFTLIASFSVFLCKIHGSVTTTSAILDLPWSQIQHGDVLFLRRGVMVLCHSHQKCRRSSLSSFDPKPAKKQGENEV